MSDVKHWPCDFYGGYEYKYLARSELPISKSELTLDKKCLSVTILFYIIIQIGFKSVPFLTESYNCLCNIGGCDAGIVKN